MTRTWDVPPIAHTNHGKTPAAWILCIGLIVGSVLVGVGMCLSSMMMIYAGVAITVVGIIVGAVLRAVGMGQKPKGKNTNGVSAAQFPISEEKAQRTREENERAEDVRADSLN